MSVFDQENFSSAEKTADRLHSAAIYLLRQLRTVDRESGLSGPRLSALSVIVFAGPITVSNLAAAEQVSKPTISNLVKRLVEAHLVVRHPDPKDARIVCLAATPKGKEVLLTGKLRHVRQLGMAISCLDEADQLLLDRATRILQRISRP